MQKFLTSLDSVVKIVLIVLTTISLLVLTIGVAFPPNIPEYTDECYEVSVRHIEYDKQGFCPYRCYEKLIIHTENGDSWRLHWNKNDLWPALYKDSSETITFCARYSDYLDYDIREVRFDDGRVFENYVEPQTPKNLFLRIGQYLFSFFGVITCLYFIAIYMLKKLYAMSQESANNDPESN